MGEEVLAGTFFLNEGPIIIVGVFCTEKSRVVNIARSSCEMVL
jgi:hypothetical protein